MTNFEKIDVNTYNGDWPIGKELIIVNKDDIKGNVVLFGDALVLYGWDEVGRFDSEFTNPIYGFVSVKSVR